MKVLVVSKYFYPVFGGVESVAYYVEREIAKKEDVAIIASRDKNGGVYKKTNGALSDKKNGERMERMNVFRLPAFFVGPAPISFGVFPTILKQDFDIAHLHEPNPFQNFCAYFALKLKRKPYVITYHSDIVPHKLSIRIFKPFYNFFQRYFLFPGASRIMPTSPNYVGISDMLPAFRDKISVVPNGVDLKKFYPAKTERNKNILFAGRLIYYKGLQYLIKALPEVLRKVPEAKLIVVGDGPLKKEWQKLSFDEGVRSKVEWLGHILDKKMLSEYQDCGVFVLPSIHKTEAFGIVLLEAMACGAPVVTTDISGTVFAVGDAGVVVKPRDSKTLADSIIKILSNDKVGKEMSAKSLKQAKKFEWKKIAEMTRGIYKRVLR